MILKLLRSVAVRAIPMAEGADRALKETQAEVGPTEMFEAVHDEAVASDMETCAQNTSQSDGQRDSSEAGVSSAADSPGALVPGVAESTASLNGDSAGAGDNAGDAAPAADSADTTGAASRLDGVSPGGDAAADSASSGNGSGEVRTSSLLAIDSQAAAAGAGTSAVASAQSLPYYYPGFGEVQIPSALFPSPFSQQQHQQQ